MATILSRPQWVKALALWIFGWAKMLPFWLIMYMWCNGPCLCCLESDSFSCKSYMTIHVLNKRSSGYLMSLWVWLPWATRNYQGTTIFPAPGCLKCNLELANTLTYHLLNFSIYVTFMSEKHGLSFMLPIGQKDISRCYQALYICSEKKPWVCHWADCSIDYVDIKLLSIITVGRSMVTSNHRKMNRLLTCWFLWNRVCLMAMQYRWVSARNT